MKKVSIFVAAAALSLLAAPYRFGDSAHAMGLISADGGRARHPVRLTSGRERYTVIITATVLPPWSGDVRVAVEGDPPPTFTVRLSEPVVDLGLRLRPTFDHGVIRGLRPGDRPALWLVIEPTFIDPVCGWRMADPAFKVERDGEFFRFCSRRCRDLFLGLPTVPEGAANGHFRYDVVFEDAASGATVLRIPIVIGGAEEVGHGGH